MLDILLNPINIIIGCLGAGFLLPLIYQKNQQWAVFLFYCTLFWLTLIGINGLNHGFMSNVPIQVFSAGFAPPLSINLQFGLHESLFILGVNTVGLIGAWYLHEQLREKVGLMILFLILIMGIDGMIMTRDLFNLFIFIEITAIAAFALIAIDHEAAVLTAGFKYVIAGTLASSFFLLGTMFLYHQTGTLNIDDMVSQAHRINGPFGTVALALVLGAILIELKTYPANGWGLDVYQNVSSGIAALLSVCVSAGFLFALYKFIPFVQADHLTLVLAIFAATFLGSNFMGLVQTNAKRLLGYSSIAQIALIAIAGGLLIDLQSAAMPLVVGGLFLNHLLAKAGLFWLAGRIDKAEIADWVVIRSNPLILIVFTILIAALTCFPPFPGFWAKWQLLLELAKHHAYLWSGIILVGSLLEAAYLFRWFGNLLHGKTDDNTATPISNTAILPVIVVTGLLFGTGIIIATEFFNINLLSFIPIGLAFIVLFGEKFNARIKTALTLAILCVYTYKVLPLFSIFELMFAMMLLFGALIVLYARFYRADDNTPQTGFFPLVTMMIVGMGELLRANTTLEFFYAWELVTLSSYFIIALQDRVQKFALTYFLFSLGGAFFILAGFAIAYADSGTIALVQAVGEGTWSSWAFALIAIGFLVKLGALGVHVWLPATYSQTDDDFTALLSSVVSKASVFGLMLAAANVALQAEHVTDVALVLGWIGVITALAGALMAAFQEDIKLLLAYSSMGQIGYIVTCVAVMSHLGWVAAVYLSISHFLFKGLLFLAVAGVIYRTQTREMYKMGGLIKQMPFTFVAALIGIIAISGVPPLLGFGGKWMLYSALLEKHWYLQAGLAFFASAVAFLYLFRLIHTVFLGQAKPQFRNIKEAPAVLLVPQALLILGILIASFWPPGVIKPISAAVATYFPATITWTGTLMQTSSSYWDGFVIINIVSAIFIIAFLLLLFLTSFVKTQKVEQFNIVYAGERPDRPETTHYAYNFYGFYARSLGFLVKPRTAPFYAGLSEWSHTIGSALRVVYTGHPQTYALYILLFLFGLYVMMKGG